MLVFAAILVPSQDAVADPPYGGVDASGHAQLFDFNRYLGGKAVNDPTSYAGGLPTRKYERKSAVLCRDDDMGDVDGCAWLIEKVASVDCPRDSLPLDPLYVSTREVEDGKAVTDWSGWSYVDGSALCLSPAVLKAEVTKAFRSLTVKPSPIRVQPATGQVLINMFTITYTDPAPQTFHITLGEGDQKVPVEVQARPHAFTWSYGSEEGDEGFPLTTTDPGKPWPDQTVTHTYTHKGPATLDLTTTWTGRFRIEGLTGSDTWTTIDGRATTTSPTVHLNVYEKRPHLVEDTLG
jgi:hypothetical protein